MYEETFFEWASSAVVRLEILKYTCSVNRDTELDGEKVCWLDVESDSKIIKIVGWDSGKIGVDAITLPAGDTILLQNPREHENYKNKLTMYMEQLVPGFTICIEK